MIIFALYYMVCLKENQVGIFYLWFSLLSLYQEPKSHKFWSQYDQNCIASGILVIFKITFVTKIWTTLKIFQKFPGVFYVWNFTSHDIIMIFGWMVDKKCFCLLVKCESTKRYNFYTFYYTLLCMKTNKKRNTKLWLEQFIWKPKTIII